MSTDPLTPELQAFVRDDAKVQDVLRVLSHNHRSVEDDDETARREHGDTLRGEPGYCAACYGDGFNDDVWPCRVAVVLALLADRERKLAEVEAQLAIANCVAWIAAQTANDFEHAHNVAYKCGQDRKVRAEAAEATLAAVKALATVYNGPFAVRIRELLTTPTKETIRG